MPTCMLVAMNLWNMSIVEWVVRGSIRDMLFRLVNVQEDEDVTHLLIYACLHGGYSEFVEYVHS